MTRMTRSQTSKSSLGAVSIHADFYCGICQANTVDTNAALSSWTHQEYGNEVINHSLTCTCPSCGKDVEFDNPSISG